MIGNLFSGRIGVHCYEREENDDVISNQRSEFSEKAQKNEVVYGEECSCMGSGDSDRITGGICAGVLCGNEIPWSLPYQMAVRYW